MSNAHPVARMLLQTLTIAFAAVQLVQGQPTEPPTSPLRPYPTITGAEERALRLGQNPELLELAAMVGESVLIEITSAQQSAIVQEGVNAYIDCFPWLSRFPGGTTVWYIQDLDENGTPSGDPALMERTPDDQLNERRVVGGPFNRWLNITGTLIVQGAEDPDFGRYICSTCIARDTPEEQCHNATVTLFLVGGPPTLDEAINNEPEPDISTPARRVYRIGADFCLEPDLDVQTVTIRCAILGGDTDAGRVTTFPQANRTWIKDDIVMTDNPDGDVPMFEEEFLMTENNGIFTPMLINPTALGVAFSTGNIVLNTMLFNLTNPGLAPPGLSDANLREVGFMELLGTYECRVGNVFGADSATSVVRECGVVPALDGCDGGVDETLIVEPLDIAPAGCNVCIMEGSFVFLNCTASEGTEPIMYEWTGPMAGSGIISSDPLLSVSMEGEYNCTASNFDLPEGVQLTTNVFITPFASFQGQIVNRFGDTLETNGCDRLRSMVNPAPDLCLLLGETLNLMCVDSETGSPLNITSDIDDALVNSSMVLDDETQTNITFVCMLNTDTPCGNVASMLSVRVFDPARVDRSSMLAAGDIGAGRSTSVQLVDDGTSVTLSCPVSGIDDPDTQWARIETNSSGVAAEVPINESNPDFTVSVTADEATLTISSYDGERDDGVYVCRTANIAGEDAAIVALSSTPDTGEWVADEFSRCNVNCNTGVRVRSVVCRSMRDGRPLPNSECTDPRPVIEMDCSDLFEEDCFLDPIFVSGEFGPCSLDCKGGFRKRDVTCTIPMTGQELPDSHCFPQRKPPTTELCPNTCCVADQFSACRRLGSASCSNTVYQQVCCWTCMLRVIP